MGVSPEDITDVVITHAHHDHIEAVHHFQNAVVHISKQAYARGKHYIPENMSVHCFAGEYDMQEQIKIVEQGGHAEGSAIVEIRTEDTVHVLAGDECYTNANIAQRRCTGTYCDKEKATVFVEKYGKDAYCVHTCHDTGLKTERII